MLQNLGTLETVAVALILTGGVVSTLWTARAVARSMDDSATAKPARRRRPSQTQTKSTQETENRP